MFYWVWALLSICEKCQVAYYQRIHLHFKWQECSLNPTETGGRRSSTARKQQPRNSSGCCLQGASSSSRHWPAGGGEYSRFCPGCCLHAIQQPEQLSQLPSQWLIKRELEQSLWQSLPSLCWENFLWSDMELLRLFRVSLTCTWQKVARERARVSPWRLFYWYERGLVSTEQFARTEFSFNTFSTQKFILHSAKIKRNSLVYSIAGELSWVHIFTVAFDTDEISVKNLS